MIHFSKQFSLSALTSVVAYVVANSCAISPLIWSTIFCCSGASVGAAGLEPPRPRNDIVGCFVYSVICPTARTLHMSTQ